MSVLLKTTKLISTDLDKTREFGDWRVLVTSGDLEKFKKVKEPVQIHGGNILDVDGFVMGSKADGILVSGRDEVIAVSTADCAPVVIISDDTALALHVSRKTLIHGLLDNALTYLNPALINRVFVGPHLCEFHFGFEEEGADLKRFRLKYPEAVHFHNKKIHLSLRKALLTWCGDNEIHPDRIIIDGRCTYESDDLPSYRQWLDKGKPTDDFERIKTMVWR